MAPSAPTNPVSPLPGLPAALATCAVHPSTTAVGLCTRCGSYICAWCRRLNDLGEVYCATCLERVGAGTRVPWDQRHELGIWRAAWHTFKQSMLQPDDFFTRATRNPKVEAPLLYAMMCGWIGQFGSLSPLIVLMGAVTVPLGVLTAVYAGGGITHLFARMLGGRGSYAATARLIGFSQGAGAVALAPIVGMLVAPVWTIILQVYGIRHAHGLSTGRSVLAVLLPILVLSVTCVGLLVIVGLALPEPVPPSPGSSPTP